MSSQGNNGGDFNWDSEEQGVILSAFFYGYMLTQIPGGYLAEKYGGKWLFGVGILLTAVLTLLSPAAAYASKEWFIAVRFLEGFFEGVTFPALQSMMAKWLPTPERSQLAAWIFAGDKIKPNIFNVILIDFFILVSESGTKIAL